MIAVFVNCAAVFAGSVLGLVFSRFISEKITGIIKNGAGTVVLVLGISMSLNPVNIVFLTLAVIAGGLVGSLIDIEGNILKFGEWAGSRFEKKYTLTASEKERAYLAEVLKVPSVKSFEAEIMLKMNRKEHRLDVWGKVRAELELQSVISLENFYRVYEPEFEMVFDTLMSYREQKELIDEDISADVPDIVENGKIDLAQIAVEQVALVMEDYPRREGEVFEFVSEFDEETTRAQNPFNVLAKLKK